MYQLKDLMGDVIKGRYYKQQLRKAPTPGVDYQFEVINYLKLKNEFLLAVFF
jgi:hypothetical protein